MPALDWWKSSSVQLRHSLEEESRQAFSITLCLPAFQLALQTKLQSDSSRAFALQRQILPPCIYSVPGKACRHMEISGEIRISAPNGDIEKITVFSGISICRLGQGSGPGRCRQFYTYPCKTLFPTIRLVWHHRGIWQHPEL
ncbi:hypothetical protein AVEN_22210-1 [Araneus ventricosus]|uniref:Uncharacterized protein n=1 Tax=Araneus ventricosus TaxID=182803 RepID=A0A4Y2MVL9_ARAVE|nr:hypothetical protein AVEN_22210-1 [Araneus ventricosus]